MSALLTSWNSQHNLVSKGSLVEVWQRHVWDCAQLAPLIPHQARTLADLGSGAGFPALVLATLRPDIRVTLYEATSKKCVFLTQAAERFMRRWISAMPALKKPVPRPLMW